MVFNSKKYFKKNYTKFLNICFNNFEHRKNYYNFRNIKKLKKNLSFYLIFMAKVRKRNI